MSTARRDFASVLLTNGKVLVVGGYSGLAVLATSEKDKTRNGGSVVEPLRTVSTNVSWGVEIREHVDGMASY